MNELMRKIIDNIPVFIASFGGYSVILVAVISWYSKILENKIIDANKLQIAKLLEDYKANNENYIYANKIGFDKKVAAIEKLSQVLNNLYIEVKELKENIDDGFEMEDIKKSKENIDVNFKNYRKTHNDYNTWIPDQMDKVIKNANNQFENIIKNISTYIRCYDKGANMITLKSSEVKRRDIYDLEIIYPVQNPLQICELCENCDLKYDFCQAFEVDDESQEYVYDYSQGTAVCERKLINNIDNMSSNLSSIIEDINKTKKEIMKSLLEK